jgi:hypothetical protein
MQAVCTCLGEDHLVKWKRIDPNDASKGMDQDFWGYSKRNILNIKLIKRI